MVMSQELKAECKGSVIKTMLEFIKKYRGVELQNEAMKLTQIDKINNILDDKWYLANDYLKLMDFVAEKMGNGLERYGIYSVESIPFMKRILTLDMNSAMEKFKTNITEVCKNAVVNYSEEDKEFFVKMKAPSIKMNDKVSYVMLGSIKGFLKKVTNSGDAKIHSIEDDILTLNVSLNRH